jgi:hypothetical protein
LSQRPTACDRGPAARRGHTWQRTSADGQLQTIVNVRRNRSNSWAWEWTPILA